MAVYCLFCGRTKVLEVFQEYFGKRPKKRRFSESRLLHRRGKADGDLLGFLPNFVYVYNVPGMSDREITALGNAFLRASLLTLKHTFDTQWLNANFTKIMATGLSGGYVDLGPELLVYYLRRAKLSPEEVRELIQRLPQTIRRKVMSTYELLKAEGFELGVEKGIEKGAELKSYEVVSNLLATGKFSDSEIANFATVTEEFVRKVKADPDKKKK